MEDLQARPFWCRLFWGHKQPAPERPSLQINGVWQHRHQPTSHCVPVMKFKISQKLDHSTNFVLISYFNRYG